MYHGVFSNLPPVALLREWLVQPWMGKQPVSESPGERVLPDVYATCWLQQYVN